MPNSARLLRYSEFIVRIFFVISMIILGCGSPTAEHFYLSSPDLLESSGVKYIPVDSTVRTPGLDLQLINHEDEEYLIYLSKRSIYIHNFSSGQLYRKIDIESQGPNSIGGSISYFAHTIDSIFVLNDYEIALFNAKGELIYKNDISKNLNNFQRALPPDLSTSSYNPVVKSGDVVNVPGAPYISPFDLDNFIGEIGAVSINLRTNEIREFLKYPKEYRENYYTYNHMAYASCYLEQKGSIVYSFQSSPYLFFYDLQQNLKDSVLFNSRYIGEITGTDYPITDTEELFRSYVLSPSYNYVYYDRFNEKLYRIAQYGRSAEDFEKRIWWKKNILMTKNLESDNIQEKLLSEQLDASNLIISKDGIFMRHANLNNKYPENSDDFIILEKYERL